MSRRRVRRSEGRCDEVSPPTIRVASWSYLSLSTCAPRHFLFNDLDFVLGFVAGEVQEDIVQTWFSELESGDRNAGAVDSTQGLGSRRGTFIDRQLKHGAVEVGGLGRDVGDQPEGSLRVAGGRKGDRKA